MTRDEMFFAIIDIIFTPLTSIYKLIDIYLSSVLPHGVPFFEIVCCIAVIYLLFRLVFKGV